MRKLFNKLCDRRGITMTEVIVAMAVVLIVTGAAISLLVASRDFDNMYKSRTYAYNACESAVECIRFADSVDELGGYLSHLGFEKVSDNTFALKDCKTEVVVLISDNSWQVELEDEVIYETKK